MQAIVPEKLDGSISRTNSPIQSPEAWRIESFLLNIFEYGDYSFRKALTGRLSRRLQCTFFTAQCKCDILAAAGSIYSMDNPAIAILGPVCTDPEYRRKGLASETCGMLLEYLKTQEIQAVYLGVRDNVAAKKLYQKLGFLPYNGIVMRKLFVNKNAFNQRYSSGLETVIRRIEWKDFAETSAMLCESVRANSFDFESFPFLTPSNEIERFLPVFPALMNSLEKNCGYGSVLETKQYSSIVGAAAIKTLFSKTLSPVSLLNFFVLDGFWDKGRELVCETIRQTGFEGSPMILCCCVEGDIHKNHILCSLGAEPYSVLPDLIRINQRNQSMVIYKLRRLL